jgi:LysM repeat protein
LLDPCGEPRHLEPDLIFPAEVIHIPAQAYMVVKGDYLYKIAKDHGVSPSVVEALNDQIDNPDLLFQGQIIKVPARKFGIPFCTTLEPGGSLSRFQRSWALRCHPLK